MTPTLVGALSIASLVIVAIYAERCASTGRERQYALALWLLRVGGLATACMIAVLW